jgi:tetratricopeptide (TPR) repeat protein
MQGRDVPFRAAVALGLLLSVAFVYLPTGGYPFVPLDDPDYVLSNPVVRQGLTAEGASWAFTTFATGNWHPLAWLSHMADVSLFGVDPGMHHLVNAALHAANAILLFGFLAGATGARWRSAFAAALFALHPLHVEPVAWVSERKELLCAFFALSSIVAYRWYAARPGVIRYLAVAGTFALALLSKPMAVTLPFLLLLLDWWPLGRLRPGDLASVRRLALEKVPLLLMSVGASAVTLVAQQGGGAIRTLEEIPFGWRVANALASYAAYLRQAAWPSGLAVLYPHPGDGLSIAVAAFSALLLAGVTVAAVRGRDRFRWLLPGWLWFLGMLVPVIGLVQAGAQARADRYAYLPLAGLVVIAAWGGEALFRRLATGKRAAAAVACAILAALALLARTQAGYWKDGPTLYTRALRVTERNWKAHYGLGTALLGEGRDGEALRSFEAALAIRPEFAEAHTNAGVALMRMGRAEEAAAHFREALAIWPEDRFAQRGLAAATGWLGAGASGTPPGKAVAEGIPEKKSGAAP